MGFHPKNIGRTNDFYPFWDMDVFNNVGSDLAVGAVALVDYVTPGTASQLIPTGTSNTLQAKNNTYLKATVLPQPNSSGILNQTYGRVRVQGPCLVGIATGNAFTQGDPIGLYPATNGTGGALVAIPVVTAPGTNSTYIPKTVGVSLATTASLGTAQTMLCFFDGTDTNVVFLKD